MIRSEFKYWIIPLAFKDLNLQKLNLTEKEIAQFIKSVFGRLISNLQIRWSHVTPSRIVARGEVAEIFSYDDPKTILQAKFSMPFCLAMTVLDRRVKPSHFEDAKLSDPKVRKLMEKIKLYVHPDMQDKSGLSQEFALVKVRLKDGREYVEKMEDSKRKGSKLNPLSWEELTSKYIDCAQQVLDAAAIDRSMEILERLEDVPNIRELMTLYNRS